MTVVCLLCGLITTLPWLKKGQRLADLRCKCGGKLRRIGIAEKRSIMPPLIEQLTDEQLQAELVKRKKGITLKGDVIQVSIVVKNKP